MILLIRYLGALLVISAFFRVVPIVTALIYRESFYLFVVSAVVSFALGLLLILFSYKDKSKKIPLDLTRGLMLVALSFVVLPAIGAISYMPTMDNNYLNALFESISGFTTTGLSVYPSLDELPRSLLMWRVETQWLGGIGIVMVFLFFFSHLRAHTYSTFTEAEEDAEKTNTLYQIQGFTEKIEPGLKKSIAIILSIYFFNTLLGIALLYLSGMPLFNAIGMSFTAISTGGFSMGGELYVNNFQMAILCLLMIFGAISFVDHYKLVQKKFREYALSFEKNVFLVVLLLAIVLSFLVFPDLPTIIFVLTSAFTTTGYGGIHIVSLPQILIFMIILGMLMGGSVGSTAGGIKVFRFYYLTRSIGWFTKKLSSPPDAVIPFMIEKKPVDVSVLLAIGIFFFFYLLLLVIGTIILMLLGNEFFHSFFQIVSALGTAGIQSTDIVSMHDGAKMVMILYMILGRLEIFPLFVLFRKMTVR